MLRADVVGVAGVACLDTSHGAPLLVGQCIPEQTLSSNLHMYIRADFMVQAIPGDVTAVRA